MHVVTEPRGGRLKLVLKLVKGQSSMKIHSFIWVTTKGNKNTGTDSRLEVLGFFFRIWFYRFQKY